MAYNPTIPVEWCTNNIQKIATDNERNNTRDALLAVGGTGAIGAGTALEHRPRSKAFDMTKAVLYVGGDAVSFAGSLHAAENEAFRRIDNHFGRYKEAELARKHRNLGLKAAGLGLAAKKGALLLNKIPYPVSKKHLAAKLGLITGGATAAGVAAYNQMKEKNASNESDQKRARKRMLLAAGAGLLGGAALGTAGGFRLADELHHYYG